MKKIILAIMLIVVAPFSLAQESTGPIQELKICATGDKGIGQWIRLLQFKVDNKWYSTLADAYADPSADADNPLTTSIIMMAFSQNLTIKIRATNKSWAPLHSRCGITNGTVFHGNNGDHITITR
ncbi:hypothetical protein [Vibrio tapetis]|uniref:Uncharacterized protein n=1 Tax=Vibrio tapetis subsp. tapetis TaxID=1671868 RepID=A0A2N8ZDD0_9VIBR|nr:hypothetical protein [Vibrio tapetis]SON49912.1 conserved exported protein of unknown function [Vibrio tapetis subsp. tapetis]